jgi:serine/threonine protein kinase
LVNFGDHLSYRYEILGVLGKGSFGQVLQCRDQAYPFHQVFQNSNLYQSLLVESLFVPDDLDRNTVSRLVVSAL